MPPDPRTLLEHIRESIELIERYIADIDFDAYLASDQTRDAVERRFITIAEAIIRLGRDAPTLHDRISEAGTIKAFRNIVVHVYDQLDHAIVWKVLQTDLPILSGEVEQMLAELNGASE